MSAADIRAAIVKRCPGPEWVTAFEVPDDAGFDKRRSADAVAMNTWPSRGLEIHGFEIKVSRTDFLRELRDPAKSATIQRYCDRWYVCIPDTGKGGKMIASTEELPVTWGLLTLRGGKLVTVREAPKLPADQPGRGFMAATLRAMQGRTVPQDAVHKMIAEARAAALKEAGANERGGGQQVLHLEKQMQELRENIRAFEQASGIQLSEWGDKTGNAQMGNVARLLLTRHGRGWDQLRHAVQQGVHAAKQLQDAEKELKALALTASAPIEGES